jgi:hypothetical protein
VLRVACLALLLGLACHADSDGPAGLPPSTDGAFEPAPVRTVVDDFPPGLSAPPFDARVHDARVPVDAAAPDAGEPEDATDAALDSCSLLAQDCADPVKACYPASRGGGVCKPAGHVSLDSGCFNDDECQRGMLCVDVFGLGQGRICERICDPRSMMACTPGPICQAFPGSSIGYCPP